ncbi:MAG: protein phosphatase [Clostridiales bacterium]|nr:protein phosphatase [Clostridiales bacterium]
MASTRKENIMENMSTYELETFLKMILEILNGCKDIEEARKKIKALLER